jgi:hypothetical protein
MAQLPRRRLNKLRENAAAGPLSGQAEYAPIPFTAWYLPGPPLLTICHA